MTAELSAGVAGNTPGAARQATPRSNSDLPHCCGEFATLTEALDYAAQGETGCNFYSSRGDLDVAVPYSRLRELAVAAAHRLLARGLRAGDRVAVLAETSPEFLAVFFGCQYAGLIACPVPNSMYVGGKEAYVQRIAGMLNSAKAAAIVSPDGLKEHVRLAGERAGTALVCTFDELARGRRMRRISSASPPTTLHTSSTPPGRRRSRRACW